MEKMIEKLVSSAAYMLAALIVAFMVPLQSGKAYRKHVRRLAARLLGRSLVSASKAQAPQHGGDVISFVAANDDRASSKRGKATNGAANRAPDRALSAAG